MVSLVRILLLGRLFIISLHLPMDHLFQRAVGRFLCNTMQVRIIMNRQISEVLAVSLATTTPLMHLLKMLNF